MAGNELTAQSDCGPQLVGFWVNDMMLFFFSLSINIFIQKIIVVCHNIIWRFFLFLLSHVAEKTCRNNKTRWYLII